MANLRRLPGTILISAFVVGYIAYHELKATARELRAALKQVLEAEEIRQRINRVDMHDNYKSICKETNV